MSDPKKGIILVGHGGIPKGYPQDLITKLKRLEAQRRASGSSMSSEELELDTKVRTWPRTPQSDPYQAGLEALGAAMKPFLNGVLFGLAYNEFCGPTLAEAVEELKELRRKHPNVTLTYAWPYNLVQVSKMLVEHIKNFS